MIGHLSIKKPKSATIHPMNLSKIKRQLIACSVSLSLAFAALAPTISFALSDKTNSQDHGLSMVICSADGQQSTIQVDLGNTGDHPMKQGHCPFCTLHVPVVHSSDTNLSFNLTSKTIYPELFYQSPKPLFAWVSLPSRAPPQLA